MVGKKIQNHANIKKIFVQTLRCIDHGTIFFRLEKKFVYLVTIINPLTSYIHNGDAINGITVTIHPCVFARFPSAFFLVPS